MLDKPTMYPLNSSSALLQQQERQLRQYTVAAISARERERERASPEPHLEIMRPVSPFQNKRQLAHQQAPIEGTTQSQRQVERPFNSHYQTHSSSQTYKQSYARVVASSQQTGQSSTGTNLKLHSNARTTPAGSRTKLNTRREASRGVRTTSRDTDISPALKMMNYDTSSATVSSDQEQGNVTTNTMGMLSPPDRSDVDRSVSPEGGGKRRNPGWRKPVPKYIPTPPSTPPTATIERLPSARGSKEPVPPVPASSSIPSMQAARTHPAPVRAYTAPAPVSSSQSSPPRPVRLATGREVPVTFRDLTASKTRVGTIQHPAQAHTRQNAGISKVTTAHIRKAVQATRSARNEDSSRHRTHVSAALTAPQVPPQAYRSSGGRSSPIPSTRRSRSPSPQLAHERAESRQESLAHPQPRKVPSMAQLVAMVLPSRSPSRSPSRTPSPGITFSSTEATEPPSTQTITETVQAPVSSLAVNRSSPTVVKEEPNKMCNVPPGALLQPDQVQLPPSRGSSARSSPSPSPLPSPRPAPVSLPIRSRSRSPTPAVTPQHAPLTPPLPSLSPGPTTALKPRPFNSPHSILNVRSAREREAADSTARVLHDPVKQITHTSREAHVISDVANENYAGNSTSSADMFTRTVRPPAEQSGQTPVGSDPVRHELRDTEPQAMRVAQQAVERRSPSPMQHQGAIPQITRPMVEEESHTVNDIVKVSASTTSAYERCMPSHSANPLFAQAKEAERRVLEDVAMSTAPRGRTPPPGQLEPFIRPSVTPTKVESSQTFEACTAGGPVVQDFNVPARRRPTPASMSEHAQVSRESGLVTPPDTPPGTITTTLNTNTDDSPIGAQERVYAAQKSEADMEPISYPPRSSEGPTPIKAPPPKVSMRRRTLIQDEQPTWKDEMASKEARNTRHLTSPISLVDPIGNSTVVLEAARREDTTVPPLPPDWKETITNAARSDTGPSASLPVPSQAEVEKIVDILPRTNLVNPQKATARDAVFTDKPVIREVSTHAEHETTVLEIHVHEVDTRHVVQAYRLPEKVTQKEQLSSTLLRSTAPSELASIITPTVKPDVVHDYPASKNTLKMEASEEPVRSRSPVRRRKVPQQNQETVIAAQESPEEPSSTSATDELQVIPKSSAQRSAVPSSQSHSSSLKRKPRTNRTQSEKDDSATVTARSTDPIDDAQKSHRAQGALADDIASGLVGGQPPANCLTPPQRLQSLGNRKRLPLNGSESSLVQHPVKDAAHDDPSSPYLTGRSLPASSQSQAPTRPPRHLHGQHKRLPAPEVTQAYRPPTPPIPSHYKKKSSNDMLPTEPPTFMKPAVHVIYPDTSTSHEHSLSGESVLNVSYFKSNNTERGQTPMGLNSAAVRARSPSPVAPAPQEQDDNDEIPEAYPQVPLKTWHQEMAGYGSPSSRDRPPEFAIQHATKGPVRYPSEPVGQARAHILTLPPNPNSSRSRAGDNADGIFNSNMRPRRAQQPHAKKAARSHSEKLFRKNDNAKPLARSRSTPVPTPGQGSRRGFWRIFGLWARIFMAKFKTWTSPAPSPSQSSEYGGYYDTY